MKQITIFNYMENNIDYMIEKTDDISYEKHLMTCNYCRGKYVVITERKHINIEDIFDGNPSYMYNLYKLSCPICNNWTTIFRDKMVDNFPYGYGRKEGGMLNIE